MKRVLSIKNQVLRVKKAGFTLIELLVVISIIGLLAGLILSNVSGIRERARDVARKSDLDQIKKALRIYYNDFNEYPAGIPEAGLEFSNGSMVYLKRVPGDPRSKDPYGYYRASCADELTILDYWQRLKMNLTPVLKSLKKNVRGIAERRLMGQNQIKNLIMLFVLIN